jgi:hypothetical protein
VILDRCDADLIDQSTDVDIMADFYVLNDIADFIIIDYK